MGDLTIALSALASNATEYERADAVYGGYQPEVFTSQRMAHLLRHTGKKFRLNFARTPVTAVLDRMEIATITAADARSDAALQVIWAENQMQLEAQDVHRTALVNGDAYLLVWPDETGFPLMHLKEPLGTRVLYDPGNKRRKIMAVNTWVADDKRVRADLWYPDRIERYVTKTADGQSGADEREFEPFSDEQSDGDPLENPYGVIPFFHFRTARPYGRPEHADAFGPQDAINKHVITQMSTTDFQAFPQRYTASEMGGHQVPAGAGSTIDEDDWDDVSAADGHVDSGMQAGPGTILEFVGKNLKIGQFTAADPEAFLKPLRFYVQAMSSLTATPMHLFEGMGDVPSGESLRAAEAPLTKKVRDRESSFGATWSEALEFALETIGIGDTVSVSWRDPASTDTRDSWEAAKLQIEAGVPREVVWRERGYAEAEIAEWANQTPAAQPVLPSNQPEETA